MLGEDFPGPQTVHALPLDRRPSIYMQQVCLSVNGDEVFSHTLPCLALRLRRVVDVVLWWWAGWRTR